MISPGNDEIVDDVATRVQTTAFDIRIQTATHLYPIA